MEKFKTGPLHPRCDYNNTNLKFVQVKIFRSGNSGVFREFLMPDQIMEGAICGLQAIMIPDKKNGIAYSEQLLGTAFFIAPGVAVSAWHVLEDFLPEPIDGRWDSAPMPAEFQLMSLFDNGEVLVWPIGSFSVGANASQGSDVMAIGCHLSGLQPTRNIIHCLTVSPRFPAIGEELYMLGLKEPLARGWNSRPIVLETYESAGTVTDVYPNGRGKMPMGPCFALDSGATGGMSGSPVFDKNGLVVGILSTGTDDRTYGYSIVSSIAPVLDHKITQSWRSNQENVTVRELLGSF